MLRVPGRLTLCHVSAALTLRFIKTAPWPYHNMLCLPRNCQLHQHKVPRLPRESDTLTLTPPRHVTQRNKSTLICQEIDLCERRPMVRLGDLSAGTLRTVADGCERRNNSERTRLQPLDLQN